MPELPDIEAYLAALLPRVVGHPLERVTVISPFVLRSVEPPIDAAEGCAVTGLRRLGKRVVIELDTTHSCGGPVPRERGGGPLFMVIHLMIAGRFQWKPRDAKPPGRIALACFRFPSGQLVLTEAGTQRRASIYLVCGEPALAEHDPGGLELLDPSSTPQSLHAALTRQNRTLKRALTDPATISGIGNAYSDEILHAARLSPILLTSRLTSVQSAALLAAARDTLTTWRDRLSAEFLRAFPGPGDVTAFRPEFAAHGKFRQPCPRCGTRIQRIARAANEINYCPGCQTNGKILADRSLSRLLKDDWPDAAAGRDG